MVGISEYFERVELDSISEYISLINEEKQSCQVGFYNLPLEFDGLISRLEPLRQRYAHKSHIVLIGMGGSSVGTRAITSFLGIDSIDYLDNVSSVLFSQVLSRTRLDDTLFVLVSKSGNTIECLSYLRLICAAYNLDATALKPHLLGICMKDTSFYGFLQEHDIERFELASNVSGRFSVLSSVGIVPLYLAGAPVSELISGAIACMNDTTAHEHIARLAYTLSTKMINKNYVLFTYCEELRCFNEWFIQLVAESLGKQKRYKRLGITPIGLIGPKDQHSFLQLIMEGPKDKFVQFIRLRPSPNSPQIPQIPGLERLECHSIGHSLDELLYAQSKSCLDAIRAEGIEACALELDGYNAYDIGYLIYYYELLVGACGLMMGINTYDQPGVESAKKLLKVLLTQ